MPAPKSSNIYFVLHIFGGKPNSKCLLTVLKGRFPLTRFWLCTLTQVNFNHVNKIEARCKLLRLNVKLSEILLLRLRATFFIHCLYFSCERKFYARTHGKITRQWKSTLNLITIVSALTPIIKKYFVQTS